MKSEQVIASYISENEEKLSAETDKLKKLNSEIADIVSSGEHVGPSHPVMQKACKAAARIRRLKKRMSATPEEKKEAEVEIKKTEKVAESFSLDLISVIDPVGRAQEAIVELLEANLGLSNEQVINFKSSLTSLEGLKTKVASKYNQSF